MMNFTPVTMSVIGCGYLGAVHAAAMAHLGHDVIGVDTDPARTLLLAQGKAPIFEPGLDEILAAGGQSGRLSFTTNFAAVAPATIHFICVGTPQMAGTLAADLSHLEAAVDALIPVLKPGDVVVGKSTVPVGTAAGLAERIRRVQPGASLVWNPEFLREGFAIEDTLRPDRIVFGLGDDPASIDAGDRLRRAYGPILGSIPLVVTDYQTAELVKVAANAFLATKISFINAVADVCDLVGADVVELAGALGHDTRIGRRFLNAGLGFGGGCLPKDIRAFMARAEELGADQIVAFLREVDSVNRRRREKVVAIVQEWLGGSVSGKRIAVLGAAFKPDSDDIRDSPALEVAESLYVMGAEVVVTDPRAIPNAKRQSPRLTYAVTAEEAATSADVVLLLTEWREFLELDPEVLGKVTHARRVLDARNSLDVTRWVAAGWEYRGLGRPAAGAEHASPTR